MYPNSFRNTFMLAAYTIPKPFTLPHRSVANDRYSLWKLGITHVLNAAHGKAHCQGSAQPNNSTY